MLTLFASSIIQVMLFGLLLGAGLPAVFALGIRFMAAGSGGDAAVGSHGPDLMSRTLGIVCFVVVAVAVALGIMMIVSSGFGYKVSFDHIVPLLEKK